MAPKEKAPKEKAADGPANTEDDKSIAMETELLISFLRSKMGRSASLGRQAAAGSRRSTTSIAPFREELSCQQQVVSVI
jgi:hypothetical protein